MTGTAESPTEPGLELSTATITQAGKEILQPVGSARKYEFRLKAQPKYSGVITLKISKGSVTDIDPTAKIKVSIFPEVLVIDANKAASFEVIVQIASATPDEVMPGKSGLLSISASGKGLVMTKLAPRLTVRDCKLDIITKDPDCPDLGEILTDGLLPGTTAPPTGQ
jgi:hypothetical protein